MTRQRGKNKVTAQTFTQSLKVQVNQSLCVRMPECHVEWKQCKVVVPVSQLVLPVGVMGLTVNGKTPTPEPGSIVGTVRFKERHEDTHKVMSGSENSESHTNTQRMESVQLACTWTSFGVFFGSLQAVSQGSQPFDVLQREAQRGQRTSKPLQHVTSSLAGRSPWGTPIGQTARLLLKQKSGQGCNT